MDFRQGSAEPSELVIGLIGPIGCNRAHVVETIEHLARHFKYASFRISVSKLIEAHAKVPDHGDDQYVRVKNLILAGNQLRQRTNDNSVLAKLAAEAIAGTRPKSDRRNIYIIDSIKHPAEVEEFRNVYGSAFYLIGISSSQARREAYLNKQCHIGDPNKIKELIKRDRGESFNYGQSTSEAFHRSDFFLSEDGNNAKVWNTLERFFDLIFAAPYKTPTFHEYAMYLAYGASLRSADMSRQVGAVVTHGTDVLATGANECPAPGGGTYWPKYDRSNGLIDDVYQGRDYMRGYDHNAFEKSEITKALMAGLDEASQKILAKNISGSSLASISEYGRVVHAEMDALLTCARRGIGTSAATLFCTTFPCHNCAKHIVASGVKKVVYIEPYPKSRAFDMHSDALRGPDDDVDDRALFIPFVGVGPRQFVNLFSMTLGAGARVRRKGTDGTSTVEWSRETALPRVKVLPTSYYDNESVVTAQAAELLARIDPVVIPAEA